MRRSAPSPVHATGGCQSAPSKTGRNPCVGPLLARKYAVPARPFLAVVPSDTGLSLQQRENDMLDIADVTAERIVTTSLHHNVTAALEIMSRFVANPKWLVYVLPTMSPSETKG